MLKEDGFKHKYLFYVVCPECSEKHATEKIIEIDIGPVKEQSIGDISEGKEMPPELEHLLPYNMVCPKTGRKFSKNDPFKAILVPQ